MGGVIDDEGVFLTCRETLLSRKEGDPTHVDYDHLGDVKRILTHVMTLKF